MSERSTSHDKSSFALPMTGCTVVCIAFAKSGSLSASLLRSQMQRRSSVRLESSMRSAASRCLSSASRETFLALLAAAMAAGAAVAMLGGSPTQVGHAVSIVFKNVLGLVCDPVAGLVEVPCIKRNGACALQALAAAELALAGIESFIPADEAIDAMKSVGDSLPCALKETAGGGMATTPTALAWAKTYFAK